MADRVHPVDDADENRFKHGPLRVGEVHAVE